MTDFTEQYFSLSHIDAIKKLNADFALNLPFDGYDRAAAEKQIKARKREQQRQKAEEQRLHDRYWELFDDLLAIDKVLTAFRPIGMDIAPPRIFTEALIRKDRYEKELEFAAQDLRRQKGSL